MNGYFNLFLCIMIILTIILIFVHVIQVRVNALQYRQKTTQSDMLKLQRKCSTLENSVARINKAQVTTEAEIMGFLDEQFKLKMSAMGAANSILQESLLHQSGSEKSQGFGGSDNIINGPWR